MGLLKRRDFDEEHIKSYSSIIKKISNEMKFSYIDPYEWLGEYDFMDAVHPSIISQGKLSESFYVALVEALKE